MSPSPLAPDAERHLSVTIRSQPAHRPAVQQLLLQLVSLVRQEPGCLYYNLYQQIQEADTFRLAAAWADEEAAAAHPTPAQAQLVAQLLPLLTGPLEVVPLRRVSELPA